jgi:hypothetical protein
VSQLLNALKEAERTRKGDAGEEGPLRQENLPARETDPGYFWTSIGLLLLTCGLIYGGYYLLRDALLAAAP